jgi:hypothetical protein
LRQMVLAGFEFYQGAFEPFNKRAAFTGSHRRPQLRTGTVFTQTSFNPVELLDLVQQPAR